MTSPSPSSSSSPASPPAPSADDNPFSGPLTGQRRQSALAAVSPLVWALLAIVVVLAVILGFVLADRRDSDGAAGPASEAAGPSAPADSAAAAKQDSRSLEELAATVRPGTHFADGTGDATLFGPGGDLQASGDPYQVHRRSASDPFAIGAIDAPVVISEFSDFECPFCSRHANETEPGLIATYVDSGLVRIEWNDFPVNGPAAMEAAKAGRAAAAQGRFRQFKEEIYAASRDVNGHPNNDIDDFVAAARKAGVADLERFRAQATDGTFDQVVTKARDYASGIGVTGTPSFVIGDMFVSGAQPAEVFDEAIRQQLAKVADGEVKVPKAHA